MQEPTHECPCRCCQTLVHTAVRKRKLSYVRNHLTKDPGGHAFIFKCTCSRCLGQKDASIFTCKRHWDRDVANTHNSIADGTDSEDSDHGVVENSTDDESDRHPSDCESKGSEDGLPQCSSTNFARMMLAGIANDRITMGGTDFVLASLHDTILATAPPEIQMGVPRDWRSLKSLAGTIKLPHWYEHFCPKNHHRFKRDDPDDVRCPLCEADTRYKPGPFLIRF